MSVQFFVKLKTRKGVKIIITKEMKRRIQKMALLTWDTIGDDVLKLIEEEGKETSLSQEDVIDVVSDASYMFYHGKDVDAYRIWDKLPYEQQIDLLKEAFPHQHYN